MPLLSIRHIAGLYVAVNDTVAMSERQSRRNVSANFAQRAAQRIGPSSLNDGGKRAAVDVLHDDEVRVGVFAPVVDRDDVRVAQLGGVLRLATEAFDEAGVDRKLRKQHFERHGPIEQGVLGQVDVSHPPRAILDWIS